MKQKEHKIEESMRSNLEPGCWSPKERKIFYLTGYTLHIYDVAQRANITITTADTTKMKDPFPAMNNLSWSPDGKRIVLEYHTYKRQSVDALINIDLFVMNSDGTGLRNITNSKDLFESNPVWISNNEIIANVEDIRSRKKWHEIFTVRN